MDEEKKNKSFKKKKVNLKLPSFGGLSFGSFGSFKLPKWGRPSLPVPSGIYLGGGKLILFSLGTVALGFIASMFLLMSTGEQEITWPMTGAEYNAPSMIGAAVVDTETPEEASQTLKINLTGGTRLDKITLTDISLGKADLATAFQIAGTSTAYIVVDDLIIRNSELKLLVTRLK